jgi:hypothetical protein
MKNRAWMSALGGVVLLTTGVQAARAEDQALLTLGAGVFDLVSHHTQEFEAEAQYRFAYGFFGGDGVFRGLKPIVGFLGNSAKAFYGYAGFAVPFAFDDDRWEIVPSGAVGAYHKGDGIDLGGTFEFRLGLDGSYRITENSRLGIALEHISNANTHPKNPGANSIMATWSFAFDGL